MTPKQEEIAEKIIQLFKENDGKYNVYTIQGHTLGYTDRPGWDLFKNNQDVVYRFLEDEKYIKNLDSNNNNWKVLTPKGWDFTSFADMKLIKVTQKNIEQLSLDKLVTEVNLLKSQLRDYSKTKAQSRNSFIISLVSAVVALIAAVIAYFDLTNN